MSIYTPYTYLIGWSNLNKFYYGVRFRKGCHPTDFWKKYFTSSNEVKKTREKYGEPDIIQIRKTFSTKEQAIDWEHKVLCRMRVTLREDFLNLSDSKMIVMSEEGKEVMRQKKIGKKLSEAHKHKLRLAHLGDKNHFYGKKHTKETRKKISKNHHDVSGENNPIFGTKRSDETKQKIRDSKRKYMRSVIAPDGTVYESIKEAVRETGTPRTTMKKYLDRGWYGWSYNF